MYLHASAEKFSHFQPNLLNALKNIFMMNKEKRSGFR